MHFLKSKDKVLEKFKEFHNFTMNLDGKGIKIICTDNGGEYCSKAFHAYLKERGNYSPVDSTLQSCSKWH
jgi:hypothetical protein